MHRQRIPYVFAADLKWTMHSGEVDSWPYVAFSFISYNRPDSGVRIKGWFWLRFRSRNHLLVVLVESESESESWWLESESESESWWLESDNDSYSTHLCISNINSGSMPQEATSKNIWFQCPKAHKTAVCDWLCLFTRGRWPSYCPLEGRQGRVDRIDSRLRQAHGHIWQHTGACRSRAWRKGLLADIEKATVNSVLWCYMQPNGDVIHYSSPIVYTSANW